MSTKRKRKPAGDVTIRAGDLFPNLDDDLFKAGNSVAKDMRLAEDAEDPQAMDCKQVRARLVRVYGAIWARLMNEKVHGPVPGPKGPRLPRGVVLADLLPGLAEGRRILASKAADREVRFEDWLAAYQWPGNMTVKNTTARTWITNYSGLIDLYEIREFDKLTKVF